MAVTLIKHWLMYHVVVVAVVVVVVVVFVVVVIIVVVVILFVAVYVYHWQSSRKMNFRLSGTQSSFRCKIHNLSM